MKALISPFPESFCRKEFNSEGQDSEFFLCHPEFLPCPRVAVYEPTLVQPEYSQFCVVVELSWLQRLWIAQMILFVVLPTSLLLDSSAPLFCHVL